MLHSILISHRRHSTQGHTPAPVVLHGIPISHQIASLGPHSVYNHQGSIEVAPHSPWAVLTALCSAHAASATTSPILMAVILMAVASQIRILQLFLLQLLRCLNHPALYLRPRTFRAGLCPFRCSTMCSGRGTCSSDDCGSCLCSSF